VENLRYSRYEAWHRALSAVLIISVRCKMMLVDGNLQKKNTQKICLWLDLSLQERMAFATIRNLCGYNCLEFYAGWIY
jgi:hypothetical protein